VTFFANDRAVNSANVNITVDVLALDPWTVKQLVEFLIAQGAKASKVSLILWHFCQ